VAACVRSQQTWHGRRVEMPDNLRPWFLLLLKIDG
jgi:hypothetical protein